MENVSYNRARVFILLRYRRAAPRRAGPGADPSRLARVDGSDIRESE